MNNIDINSPWSNSILINLLTVNLSSFAAVTGLQFFISLIFIRLKTHFQLSATENSIEAICLLGCSSGTP